MSVHQKFCLSFIIQFSIIICCCHHYLHHSLTPLLTTRSIIESGCSDETYSVLDVVWVIILTIKLSGHEYIYMFISLFPVLLNTVEPVLAFFNLTVLLLTF